MDSFWLIYHINREGRASPAGHLGERFGIVCICNLLLFSKILFQVYPTPFIDFDERLCNVDKIFNEKWLPVPHWLISMS